jgi:hypothetical protein
LTGTRRATRARRFCVYLCKILNEKETGIGFITPTNVSAGRISAIGGGTPLQQAGMRAIRLGARLEW